jgi:hypothetical protein
MNKIFSISAGIPLIAERRALEFELPEVQDNV